MSVLAKNPGLRPAGLRRAGNAGGSGGGGGSVTSADITDASTIGRNMLTAANAAAERTLLGLAAIATSGASADITDASAAGRALLTAASAALQRTALGLAAIASSGASADITDSTAPGRTLLTAATAALQRTALGLSALAASGASADITDSTSFGRALLTAASVAAQRTALALAAVASSGLASDLTGTVALANGGTGQTTALAAGDALSPQGANLAGGNTVDLATATGPVVTITGTGFTITSFGTRPAGAKQKIVFASSGGAIIHNGSTLICPFGASIVVTAGDVYEMTSLGGGSWRMTSYLPITASFWRTALGLATLASSPVVANLTDAGAFGRTLMQQATSTLATALLDLATTTTKGLISAANMVKLGYLPDLIDDFTLSAAGTYTSPAWTANAYSRIEVVLTAVQSGNSYIKFLANADAGAHYTDAGHYWNNTDLLLSNDVGAQNYAQVGLSVPASSAVGLKLTFFPKTTGAMRTGLAESFSMSSGAIGARYRTSVGFGWNDTTTDVTFVTLFISGQTWTGNVKVFGYS